MKKILKILAAFMTCFLVVFSSACGKENADANGCTSNGDMSLDDVNKFLNDNTKMNMADANLVAVIPFNHVDGHSTEWKFYALINYVFKVEAENYVKYQVTYLSCTCRDASVNYWQTAYMELTIPDSANGDDVELKKLSFDADGTGHYTAGFWGDSSPITTDGNYNSPVIATYDRVQKPGTVDEYYPSIKYDYIPLLVGKTKAQIDSWNKVADVKNAGVMSTEMFDSFTGASVSTNNILRILHAVMKWHVDRYL